MLTKYLNNPEYDLENSFVIGDRITDVELAKNLGSKAIFIKNEENLGGMKFQLHWKNYKMESLYKPRIGKQIYEFLKLERKNGFNFEKQMKPTSPSL
jgi:imidazoleglycerol-phosphate dehydratase / histidinol-phosphatase